MIVYTAIRGSIDAPRDDILCFNTYDKFKNETRNAKIYKILPHKYLDTDISMWIDGNIWLKESPEIVINELLGDADMALFKHFARDDVIEEGIEAAGKYPNLELQSEILDHVGYYKSINYPRHDGLYECGVLIRRHTDRVKQFCESWWAEICVRSFRDQLSFPYVIKQFPDIKVKVLDSNVREHKYFKYVGH